MAGEGTLIVSLAEEVSIDDRGDEGVLESDSAKQDADEDKKLGVGDDGHGAVVVG